MCLKVGVFFLRTVLSSSWSEDTVKIQLESMWITVTILTIMINWNVHFLLLSTVNKHKPWIETSYHGVITENMDTVLLDPPLVALDKDAPVPFAGRKNKHTHREKKHPLYSPHTHLESSTHTVNTSTHMCCLTHTLAQRQGCFSTVCRKLWQLHTTKERQKQMIQQFSVLTVCHGDWIPFITLSRVKQMFSFSEHFLHIIVWNCSKTHKTEGL